MPFHRPATAFLLLMIVAACTREQPPALPERAQAPSAPAPAIVPAPPPPLPLVVIAEEPVPDAVPQPLDSEPPPLDEQIQAFAQTGFPKCDDFFENARQCINTRLTPDERTVEGRELRNSVRLVSANAQRSTTPARVEQTCLRLQALAARKFKDRGCSGF